MSLTAKQLMGMTFCVGSKKPRQNTGCALVVEIIEDNLDECEFPELQADFKERYQPKKTDKVVSDGLANTYIREAFVKGFIEETL